MRVRRPGQFLAAASIWSQYAQTFLDVSENEQRVAVATLRDELEKAGVLTGEMSVWSVFLQQAEDGLL